ncbi:S-layer homology domain-containing protein [Paenibacillus gallinarum]|uniref:S-layer homology domain-containing protein n=1 Tax=Paenibacillus gallinarum TaxID=2762232 RepID=A0ABR8SZN8_9BACL|nr:S-layer homology domain-containing protein [Paenibacillus gallinarum]MBD7968963.1 S-layer homology domain-containing protein [Paenibacillus gallinarum]
MQRIKRPMVWLLLVSLVISMFPPGLVSKAEAAVLPTYFFPDDPTLKGTHGKGLGTSDSDLLKVSDALQVTESNFEIKGSYLRIVGSTMRVDVQGMKQEKENSGWMDVANQVTTGTIQRDSESPDNKFIANVQLYTGMNKITFSGIQGDNSGVTGSNSKYESFYVYFKPTTYIKNVNILTGYNSITLNEGATVVVPNKTITVEGKVANATKVQFTLNNSSNLPSTLLQDGTFYSAEMNLKSGLNNLVIKVTDGTSTVNMPYQLYYYEAGNSITSAHLDDGSGNNRIDLLGDDPTWTLDSTSGKLYLQFLLEDVNGTTFRDNGSLAITIDGQTKDINLNSDVTFLNMNEDGSIGSNPGTEEVFQGTAGVVPSYRMITLVVNQFSFSKSDQVQFDVDVKYPKDSASSSTSSRTLKFTYAKGQININNLQLLPSSFNPEENLVKEKEFLASAVEGAKTLNNSEVSGSSFYILVETKNDIKTATLAANYIPTGKVNVSYVGEVTDKYQYIYKVSEFKSGAQNVSFSYGSNSKNVQVKINSVSKIGIHVSSHTNGQIVSVNAKDTDKIEVYLKGQYMNFPIVDGKIDGSLYVNGVLVKSPDKNWVSITDGQFSIPLSMQDSSSTDSNLAKVLVYGENRIVLKGNGDTYITELIIYIIDENQPNIKNFIPAKVGNTKFPAEPTEVESFFDASPEFDYQGDNTYKTVAKQYNLIFRGSGASKFELLEGTKQIIAPTTIASTDNKPKSFTYNGQSYTYEIYGNEEDFVIRVQGFNVTNPGTYSYNLNVYKNTGSYSSENLTIISEVKPYDIYAPKPTVDGKYVVNKNFIHFDIYAPGATSVVIDKEPAVLNPELGESRYLLDYVGLKQDKNNSIKVVISTGGTSYTETINIYYAGAVGVDSQYMPAKISNKYSVFNKSLELSFPKGSILKSETDLGITKFYPETKILFGIANPENGIVERRNDYGQIVKLPGPSNDTNSSSYPAINVTSEDLLNFQSTDKSRNFSLISNVYWISGGLGEVEGATIQSTNGITPYSVAGMFNNIKNERKITPSLRGSLTLSYDSSVVDEVGSTIAVYRYIPITQEEKSLTGDSRPKWERIGGVVDTKKHTVTVPFDQFGYYKVMKLSKSYSDITNHSWARNILNAMYAKGYMENLTFEQFGAQDQTTRGEFATLLVKGLNLPLNYSGKLTFVDVYLNSSTAVWDYKYIETAARAGIITGVSDGIFSPNSPLTREQAAMMIARATNLKLAANDTKLAETLAKSFIDSGRIDNYARPAVLAVSKAKIMVGAPTTISGQSKVQYMFNPDANLTRAEAAKIAVELLKKYAKVFPTNLS